MLSRIKTYITVAVVRALESRIRSLATAADPSSYGSISVCAMVHVESPRLDCKIGISQALLYPEMLEAEFNDVKEAIREANSSADSTGGTAVWVPPAPKRCGNGSN